MNISKTTSVGDLRAFGTYFQEGTARSLTLLRAIGQTVLALQTIRSQLKDFAQVAEKLIGGLDDMKDLVEDKTIDSFDRAEDSLGAMHSAMRTMHDAMKRNSKLRDSDGVCEAFIETLNTLADLHEVVERLRWTLMLHNAALDTSDAGPELSTESEIHEFLASL